MLNLLGELWHGTQSPAWERILRQPDAKLHLYGKGEARPGRKMGHVTCLGETVEEAKNLALRIQHDIKEVVP